MISHGSLRIYSQLAVAKPMVSSNEAAEISLDHVS